MTTLIITLCSRDTLQKQQHHSVVVSVAYFDLVRISVVMLSFRNVEWHYTEHCYAEYH